ncbi:MAG: hypothetical protein IJ740_16795 [Ruminococcus sp.]|nr:hypothetical protein [Ruminococcus sp.]
MSLKKKVAAFVTAAAMAASMVGCADTSYVLTADGENINAGIYIDYMFSAMNQQIYIWQYTGVTENFFDQKVGDQDFADYLLTTAMDNTKKYAAVEKLFKESGLKVSAEDMKSINNDISDSWEDGHEMYEKEGISKDSLKKVLVNAKKEEMLFDYYYGTDGKEAVSKEDLKKYMDENYLRFKSITISKSTAEDDATKEAEDKTNQELFEKYKGLAEGVSFAEFDELIDLYEEETAPEEEEEETEEGEDTGDEDAESEAAEGEESSEEESSTDDSSADDSEADDSSSDESSSDSEEIEDRVESFEAEETEDADKEVSDDEDAEDLGDIDLSDLQLEDEDGNPIDMSDVELVEDDSEDADDTDAEGDEAAEEEEEDPYEHESFVNYGTLTDETLEGDYGKRLTEIKNAEVDSVITYEDDNAFYIISKGDASERTEEYLEDESNFDSVLHEAKDEDFEAKVTAAQEGIEFKENSDAINRYLPKTVYEKYNEYVNKNTTTTKAAS